MNHVIIFGIILLLFIFGRARYRLNYIATDGCACRSYMPEAPGWFSSSASREVVIHTEPILSIVDGNEILNELFVSFANESAFTFLWSEYIVIIQWIIDYWITCKKTREQKLLKIYLYLSIISIIHLFWILEREFYALYKFHA